VTREAFEAFLSSRFAPDQVRADAPMAPLTTFKVGGPADWLVDVRTTEELQTLVLGAGDTGIPVTLVGGGSNVLVGDLGIRGVVIRLRLTDIEETMPGVVRAGAGVSINGLVRWTVGRGLQALEAWAGTPGTVGGAIYGNAHFGGRNIGDLVTSVLLMTREGEWRPTTASDMAFDYDRSRLQDTHEIVVWAEFAVGRGEPDRLREVARGSLAYRKRTQPLDTPSAGCIFQNPDPGRDRLPAGVPFSAGALVDRAGLKGRVSGGARISPAHANFVLNDGHATAHDIRTLIEMARAAVRDRFGVDLHDEVVMLGEF
jgi:UDP-N-acetylmuramate dehydrogenase